MQLKVEGMQLKAMQLKVKGMQLEAMQLKVSMQKNIGKRGSTRDICSLSSSLVFFYVILLIFLLED